MIAQKIVCWAVMLAAFCWMAPAAAADGENYFAGAGQKFTRGLSNIVFSPVEIARSFEKTIEGDKPYELAIVSPLRGVAWTAGRIFVGVYEAGTFWFPQDPILKPALAAPSMREYLMEENNDGY